MPDLVTTGWWLLGVLAVGYSLHRFCLWLERHGYLYYLNSWRKGSRGLFGLALASALDPNARRILEAHREAERLQVEPQPDGSNPDGPKHSEGPER